MFNKFLRIGAILGFGILLVVPSYSHAQVACGNIVEIYYGDRYESPIEDCFNPFGLVTINPDVSVALSDTDITEAGEYPFLGTTQSLDIKGSSAFSAYAELYFHDGQDYLMIDETGNNQYSFTEQGTYTLVIYEMDQPMVSQRSLFQKAIYFLTPQAFAYFDGPSLVITFTVTEVTPEGISNILFLPGIQASRLYTDENGNERKLWEPIGDSDVELLRMTENGESIADVYTEDVVDEIGGIALGGNIYKGFLEYLKNIDGVLKGPLVETYPYDWRHDVFDIVDKGTKMSNGAFKTPISSIEFLAGTSPTHKVTLIAHSNGGLLAKAIMLKLKEEGKTDLVDKVIFIATPHIGTPKGLAAILHGFDQEHLGGLISSDEKVRSVMKNMPGVYGLLPSESFVGTLAEPMISFDGSDTAKIFRDKYGFTISNMTEYTDFLSGMEGRGDAGNSINEPGIANQSMLEAALTEHRDKLDTWSPPGGVEVFNIVGTGLATPKSIEYREFMETDCNTDQSICIPKGKIEPVLHFTSYGDETVVSRSAGDTQEGSKYYFDISSSRKESPSFIKYTHANITEDGTIQSVIDHILHASSTQEIEFVSEDEPTFTNNTDILTIHSPARIYLRDIDGNITGRTMRDGNWYSEIPESDYFEAGGIKYVLVPSNTSYEVVIEGEGEGVYTNIISQLQGDTEGVLHSFVATTSPTMITHYQKVDGIFSTVTVDTNGDGKIDMEMTQDGTIITKEDDDCKDRGDKHPQEDKKKKKKCKVNKKEDSYKEEKDKKENEKPRKNKRNGAKKDR
ncbi:MAG: hypothetical protein K9M10_00220 [Candidatus Pacebacteria bacterium]|nr:hypothetical protein [Candidatus Paceibacterota bacterium]MCF7856891.1 hypothetical protein [Candidatus Paceibacterota bacterium]